jgi:hypothetical protein
MGESPCPSGPFHAHHGARLRRRSYRLWITRQAKGMGQLVQNQPCGLYRSIYMVEEVYVFGSIEMIAFKAWFAAISLRWRRPPWQRGWRWLVSFVHVYIFLDKEYMLISWRNRLHPASTITQCPNGITDTHD